MSRLILGGNDFDEAKRRKGSKVHIAVDRLGQLLAQQVSAASEQERAQVEVPGEALREVTGDNLAYKQPQIRPLLEL
jgi:hypothetical protein